MLQTRYNIAHATLQLECVGCEPDTLYCELNGFNTLMSHPEFQQRKEG
jgi:hypothetical protein